MEVRLPKAPNTLVDRISIYLQMLPGRYIMSSNILYRAPGSHLNASNFSPLSIVLPRASLLITSNPSLSLSFSLTLDRF